jgi:RimJ/RimL family protein N-acetyltransferase
MIYEMSRPAIHLEPWGEGDLPLLTSLLGDPEMTKHLGGPESTEKLVERQAKYERLPETGTGRMFKIVDEETGQAVGSVGYWDKAWNEQEVYETGWSVLPAFQGRGIAAEATAQALVLAASDGKHRYVHAFPSVENAPSNAICRKLGFELLGEHDFEYPPGNTMRCNDWRFDLEN